MHRHKTLLAREIGKECKGINVDSLCNPFSRWRGEAIELTTVPRATYALNSCTLQHTSMEMCEGGSTSGPRPSRTICEDTCRDSTSLSTSRPRPLRGKVFPDVEGVTQSRMILTEGFASSSTEHALTRSGFDYSNSSRRRGSHPIKDESRKHEMILAATNSPNEGGVWAARVVLAARVSPN